MYSTRTFSDLNNEYRDLDETHLKLRKLFAASYFTRIQDNFFLRAKVFQRPTVHVSGHSEDVSCTILYKGPFYLVSTGVATTDNLKASLHMDLNRFFRRLNSHIKIRSDSSLQNVQGKFKLFWRQDGYVTKTVLDFGNINRIRAKFLYALYNRSRSQLGFGIGLSFGFEEKKLLLQRQSLWYYWDDNSLVLTYKPNAIQFTKGLVEGQLYNTLNSRNDVAFGASYDLQHKKNNISIAFRHIHSSKLTIKSRVDNKLNLAAAFDLLVAPNVHLVITSTYDLADHHGHPDTRPVTPGITPFSFKVIFEGSEDIF